MKKHLLLLTVQWPYGFLETFMENEAEYISGFDKVTCIPLQYKDTCRLYPSNMEIIQPCQNGNAIIALFKFIFTNCFWQEFLELIKNKRFSFARLKVLMRNGIHQQQRYNSLKKWLKHSQISDEEITAYTYWMESCTVAAARLKKCGVINKLITRCHRFDLYEEVSATNYIPFRKYIFDNSTLILPISEDGKKYLVDNYNWIDHKKIFVQRLGTTDFGLGVIPKDINELHIASCSNLIPVKRVHLMIEAMFFMQIPIVWHHFGDGILRADLEKKLTELPSNVTFIFEGRKDNRELMKWYQDHPIDIFVNTSESEGVPVSIMEAMSFGIPTIATNVGGNSEIVEENKTGWLLEKDFSPSELSNMITNYFYSDASDRLEMRKYVREFWEKHYSARSNYQKFYRLISKL